MISQKQTDISEGRRSTVPVQKPRAGRKKIRVLLDRLAAGIVRGSGLLVILSILGLIASFVYAILPLWQSPSVTPAQQIELERIMPDADGPPLLVACEEYREVAFALTADGHAAFFSLSQDSVLQASELALEENEQLTVAALSPDGAHFLAGGSTGNIYFSEVDYNPRFEGSVRKFKPALTLHTPVRIDTLRRPLRALAFAGTPETGLLAAAITQDGDLVLYRRQVESSLFGAGDVTESRPAPAILPGAAVVLAIDQAQSSLFVGFRDGTLNHYAIDEDGGLALKESVRAANTQLTALALLIGDRSLVMGDAAGTVSVWFEAIDPQDASRRKLQKAHTMAPHRAPVLSFGPSQRNRTFLTGSADGEISMQFSTNERLLYRERLSEAPITFLQITPKGNAAFAADQNRKIWFLNIDNPHPEANWRAFFGKVWYEGYAQPEYIWQSSSGADDFEAKLSLIPLIFGTLKGTFYALLFALPIAVLAALYVSQFIHPAMRSSVKPVMEIMAALPSVVIGFIGGLWLAPRVQPVVPGLLAGIVCVPLAIVCMSFLWEKLPWRRIRQIVRGYEVFLLMPIIVGLGWLCLSLNQPIENLFFGGDYQQWLINTLGLHYDQRNAFVVGLVMGFAVIPIIFTISEDALSNVPAGLTAASFALGATPWQTAYKVVLPTASPGIFSATMIGLGRAVGETMIVLMATGNTPIMDWNIFNGFRTLSANIAVEIPEAPEGGTLFRTLFLTAFLLFLMTFIVNTAAEVIRQRMREKYESK